MLVDHLLRIHPVDVIGPHDHHDVGPVRVDQVQRLIDRIRGANLPVRAVPLLRWDRGHPVVQQGVQPPGGRDVAVEAVALVLSQDPDASHTAVHQIGQREIHHPVQAAERNG